jgi:hypothetical protein
MSAEPVGARRERIEFAEDRSIEFERMPLKYRLRFAAEAALLFTVRWGIAIVLLAVVARVTLTELVTPPILRLVVSDLAEAKKQSEEAAKGTSNAIAYINLLIDRGVLPKGTEANGLPQAQWARPFVLNDKPPEPAK